MKVAITFKTPDALHYAVRNLRDELKDKAIAEGIPQDEQKEWVYERLIELETKLSKWVRFGEVITVDFDLDSESATVRKTG